MGGVLVFTPQRLAAVAADHVRVTTDSEQRRQILRKSRGAAEAVQDRALIPNRSHPLLRFSGYWDAFPEATAIAADSADQYALRQARWGAAAALRVVQDEVPQLGPRSELQRASVNAGDVDRAHRFAGAGARLIMIRDSDAGLRPWDPGVMR